MIIITLKSINNLSPYFSPHRWNLEKFRGVERKIGSAGRKPMCFYTSLFKIGYQPIESYHIHSLSFLFTPTSLAKKQEGRVQAIHGVSFLLHRDIHHVAGRGSNERTQRHHRTAIDGRFRPPRPPRTQVCL